MKAMRGYESLFMKRSVFFNLMRQQRRDQSTKTIEKSVVISNSHDIYTNLALEDWYYRNCDFTNKHMLMLWINKPCVVIGKFQNPWLECNVSQLNTLAPPDSVHLARRNSGGGTVYHDLGNLNLTFFTPKDDYKRVHNLEVITKGIFRRFGLKIDISKREDLIYNEFKVSGTASKLGRTTAYHHCTLLVDANKDILSKSLQKPEFSIETKATQSTSSKIKNLRDLNPKLNVDELIDCISNEYLNTVPYIKANFGSNVIFNHNIESVIPSEDLYPGILDIRDELKSFEWIFGKTPTFSATKESITFNVEKGLVCDIQLESKNNTYLEQFRGRKFDVNLFNEFLELDNLENSIKRSV